MRGARLAFLCLCLAPAACQDSDDEGGIPRCVDLPVDVDECNPLYQPNFDNVFQNTLGFRCAPQGTSCHANPEASGARPNGLLFSDADAAHAALMGQSDDHPFVDTEDPSCSLLLVRLTNDEGAPRMPPGESPVSDGEVCAIAQWIANGAER